MVTDGPIPRIELTRGRVRRSRPGRIASLATPASYVISLGLLSCFAIGTSVVRGGFVLRAAIAVSVVSALSVLGTRKPQLAFALAVGYAFTLATLRRYLTFAFGQGGSNDVLLLVLPAVFVVLAAKSSSSRRASDTTLGKLVLLLLGVSLIQVVNPAQGGLKAGLGGVLLTVTPVGAFFVGRAFGTTRFIRRVLLGIAFACIGSAFYGFEQTYHGLTNYDSLWVQQTGYQALYVTSTVIRAFANFASGQEYASVLVIGIIIFAFGSWPRGLLLGLRLPAIVLLATALVLESSRGPVFVVLATAGLAVALKLRVPVSLAVVCAGLAFLFVPGLAGNQLAQTTGGSATNALLSHQVAGLTNPFGSGSTGNSHVGLILSGLKEAITTPQGHGLGLVTNAGGKFGSGTASTEVDISNVAVGLGLLGLIAYLGIIGLAFRSAARNVKLSRDADSILMIALLLGTFGQWLNGGEYLVSLIPWLIIGLLDVASEPRRDEDMTAARFQSKAVPLGPADAQETRSQMPVG